MLEVSGSAAAHRGAEQEVCRRSRLARAPCDVFGRARWAQLVPAAAVSLPVAAWTQTHTGCNRAVSSVNTTTTQTEARCSDRASSVSRGGEDRAPVFPRRSNWLALTGARSSESPPRSLDMEIYRRGAGELFDLNVSGRSHEV